MLCPVTIVDGKFSKEKCNTNKNLLLLKRKAVNLHQWNVKRGKCLICIQNIFEFFSTHVALEDTLDQLTTVVHEKNRMSPMNDPAAVNVGP